MIESTNDVSMSSIERASALALAAVQSGDLRAGQAAFEELTRCNQAFLEQGDEAVLKVLGRQAIVLEALVYRLMIKAEMASRPDAMALILKTAFGAQKALLTTLSAVHQVRHA